MRWNNYQHELDQSGENPWQRLPLNCRKTYFRRCGKTPDHFAGELRLAAAVKWYEMGLVSQGRAAEISGLSRSQFISALGRFEVSVFQYDTAEIIEEVNRKP